MDVHNVTRHAVVMAISATGGSTRLGVTPGSHAGDFEARHWAHLVLVSVIFGSAFLWIALALESLAPQVVAAGRVTLGALALAAVPAARRRVARIDAAKVAAAGVFGQALPALLFAFAEQRIASATTGMLVSALPVVIAALTAILSRTVPGRRRMIGLVLGMTGVVLLAAPDVSGGGQNVVGIGLVLVAVFSYAVANIVYVPLQQRYGSLPVVLWSLVVASAVLAPLGVAGISSSRFETGPVVALLILGVLGTGVVRSLHVALVGRVGATRGSIVAWLVPVVALGLGVIVLGEHIRAVQIAGIAVTTLGGYLVSKRG